MEDLADVIRPGSGRGLDFVNLEELRKRTSVMPENVLKFAMSEMLFNALDTDATVVEVFLKKRPHHAVLSVRDNGSIKKISLDDIRKILDFDNKASSKRGFLRVSRGYLGNALKCVFGFSYALSVEKGFDPPSIIIESRGRKYSIDLKPDRRTETIESVITESESASTLTTFTVEIPYLSEYDDIEALEDIIIATSMVNPERQIHYDVFGKADILGEPAQDAKAAKHPTSILWYGLKQFESLFNDFVRVKPDAHLKDFIALFRTLTRKKPIRDILQDLATTKHNRSLQIVPTTRIVDLSQKEIVSLYHSMRECAKPIGKRSISSMLGCVGEEAFKSLKEQKGWIGLRYAKRQRFRVETRPQHRDIPYVIEVVKFDRVEDGQGAMVFQCVNFAASHENIFSSAFNIERHLGLVNITKDQPVTIVVHLVTPVLDWLGYGKSRLGVSTDIRTDMEVLFNKVLPVPKTPRPYRVWYPPPPRSWVPHGSLDPEKRSPEAIARYRKRLKDFANDILWIDSQRSVKMRFSTRGWCYILEGENKISKQQFPGCSSAIVDCRKIGFIPRGFIAPDQDTTRHFTGIHIASNPRAQIMNLKSDIKQVIENMASKSTEYWVGEKYFVVLLAEKGDLIRLFRPIADEYHVPVVSTKGWYTVEHREEVAILGQRTETLGLQLVLLMFYDHDRTGLQMTDKYRKNLVDMEEGTGWSPDKIIIHRFGLNKEDIDKHGLVWIRDTKKWAKKTYLPMEKKKKKEISDSAYERKFGRLKCEANAILKSDETLAVGQLLCRNAIEKYYGKDALKRFRKKEEASREKHKEIYTSPSWGLLDATLDEMVAQIEPAKEPPVRPGPTLQEAVIVIVDGKHTSSRCPVPTCQYPFHYDVKKHIGLQLRCQGCDQLMLLKLEEKGGDP